MMQADLKPVDAYRYQSGSRVALVVPTGTYAAGNQFSISPTLNYYVVKLDLTLPISIVEVAIEDDSAIDKAMEWITNGT